MKALVDLVKPTAAAHAVASYSYGERIHLWNPKEQTTGQWHLREGVTGASAARVPVVRR